MLALVHARHDDVAALDVAHVLRRRRAVDRVAHALDPRPGDVDDRLRGHLGRRRAVPASVTRQKGPPASRSRRAATSLVRTRTSAPRARASITLSNDEPRIVDARVGIDEALAELRLQARAPRRSRGRRRTIPAASRAGRGGRTGRGPRASSTPGAGAARAAARTPAARRCAAPGAARPRARRAIRGPAGTRTARGSASPPWISFVLHCEVAAARSPCSTSSTLRPRPAASRAMPAPLMPAPTTRRSNCGGRRTWRRDGWCLPPILTQRPAGSGGGARLR